jgi:hypothetical protein
LVFAAQPWARICATRSNCFSLAGDVISSSDIGSANLSETPLKRSSTAPCSLSASSTLPRTSRDSSSCGSCGRKPIFVPLCGHAPGDEGERGTGERHQRRVRCPEPPRDPREGRAAHQQRDDDLEYLHRPFQSRAAEAARLGHRGGSGLQKSSTY